MKRSALIFMIVLLLSLPCHAAESIFPTDILVYDNGHGITNLLDTLGLSYNVWQNIFDPEFGSPGPMDFLGSYKLVITGWNDGYGDLATSMSTYSSDWTTYAGRVVLSGQDPDAHYSNAGAQAMAQTLIDWIMDGFDEFDPKVGVLVFADMVNHFDWLPWMATGTAVTQNADDVYLAPGMEEHEANAGLTSTLLSSWGNARHQYFSTMPDGFSALTVSGAGDAVTIANISSAPIPEPMTIGLLVLGLIFLGKRFQKN